MKFSLPTPKFSFAGFTFPKWVFTLPRGDVKKRIERMRNPVTGPYMHSPTPDQSNGIGFYLDSDGMPVLRWKWCDDVIRLNHTGWFCDESQSEKIRGIIMQLPKGRGWLAGWSMGENMISEIGYTVYDSEQDAGYAADREAERAAEHEWMKG